MEAINLRRELDGLKDHWSPRVVGRVNEQYIKVAKVKGELTWHMHDDEDEMFLVVYGRLVLQFEARSRSGRGTSMLCPEASYIILWQRRNADWP
jgi:mannose-6-phosphate isomerase-like protein (cupin superfamily)